MMIGKPGEIRSAIATADSTSITVRGKDLASELMGVMTFTELFIFHLTGREATADQVFFLDALLVAITEHGITPSVQASRMTLAAEPGAMQGAVAAGILGCGSVILGAAEVAGRLIADGVRRVNAGEGDTDTIARRIAEEIRAEKKRLPGFGHPHLKPVDPRTERLFTLADEKNISGQHVAMVRALRNAADKVWGRQLILNVSGAIPAIMLDLDFPLASLKGVPILARTAGLLGHLVEEQERGIGFLIAHHAEAAVEYDGPQTG